MDCECLVCKDITLVVSDHIIHRDNNRDFFEQFVCYECGLVMYKNLKTGKILHNIDFNLEYTLKKKDEIKDSNNG